MNSKAPNLQLEIRRVRKVDLERVGGGVCGIATATDTTGCATATFCKQTSAGEPREP